MNVASERRYREAPVVAWVPEILSARSSSSTSQSHAGLSAIFRNRNVISISGRSCGYQEPHPACLSLCSERCPCQKLAPP